MMRLADLALEALFKLFYLSVMSCLVIAIWLFIAGMLHFFPMASCQ